MKSIALDSPFLYLVSICLLFIIVLLLFFRSREGDRRTGQLLLIYFLSYLYLIGISYVFIYGSGLQFIHLLRTGHIASLLMPPAAFFYVKQCLYPGRWKLSDLLHLLPALFFLVDMTPFFLLSAGEKTDIFLKMDAVEYRIGFSQGQFMPPYGHIVLRTVLIVAYWVAQLLVIKRAMNEQFHPLRSQSPFTWRWLHIFLFTQAFIFLVPIAGVFLGDSKLETVLYSFASAGIMAIQCFYLLLHPEILYTETFSRVSDANHKATISLLAETPAEVSTNQSPGNDGLEKRSSESRISDKEMDSLEPILIHTIDTLKPYERHRYTLQDFSKDTGISPYKLSALINLRYHTNFNDYLNKFRLNQVVKRIDAGEDAFKTLEAIAYECGFQNRGTFIRAFKKELNLTPSEYIERIRQSKEKGTP